MSRFAWNRIFFESFEANYVKKLDFSTYRKLRRPAARRAFRFLDKRFFHEPQWEFDLREFACEKLGFSRSYNTGQLKERLRPALGELESIGFIDAVHFRKQCPKVWKLTIAKKLPPLSETRPEPSEFVRLANELVLRGVNADAATEIEAHYPPERINTMLRYVDWLVARNDKRVSESPVGFLVAAIRRDYPLPKDYLKHLKASANDIRFRRDDRRLQKRASRDIHCRAEGRPVDSKPDGLQVYLASLTVEESARLESNAVAVATAVELASYNRLKSKGSKLFEAVRVNLLRKHITAHGLHLTSSSDEAAA